MKFLNLGCGNLFVDSDNWVNIDQSPFDKRVKKVSLENRLPFPENAFDVVYSSHVFEHILPHHLPKLLIECNRILRKGGVIRIVVPDFQEMVKAYLKLKHLGQMERASFIKHEILDQCVRYYSGGGLLNWYEKARKDASLRNFIAMRNGHFSTDILDHVNSSKRLSGMNFERIRRGILRRYFLLLVLMMPRSYKSNLVSLAHLGELHKWVYDFDDLSFLLKEAGFGKIQRVSAKKTRIESFPLEPLDLTRWGKIRKGKESMFIEAVRL
jgi:predicted SAM-dependent methyltransferase